MEEKFKLSLIRSFFDSFNNTSLQKIEEKIFLDKGINVFVKRDDLLHKFINGNKWFKLKYNLLEAVGNNISKLLTFGGAYSNHVYAYSYACKLFGFEGVVVIRGEEYQKLNPTLKFASENGIKIHYVQRKIYRDKYNESLLSELKNIYGDYFLIPEGGSNFLAVKGCSEIISNIDKEFDFIFVACGTAGTLAGISKSLKEKQKAIGVAVLKNADFLNAEVRRLSQVQNLNFEILLDYHFGGYAKFNDCLLVFIKEFYQKHQIILDPVYTGKTVYALYDLIGKDYFPEGSNVIVHHSGGLQGYQGLKKYKQVLSIYESFDWSEYEKQIINN